MKEAMWGLGLIGLAIFAIVLISLFGNITVTNQQDYMSMKNTVEAAMHDAIDMAHFRTGFCVCTSLPKQEVDGKQKWVFKSSSDYEIKDKEGDSCPTIPYKTCELLEGEYMINKKIFAESLVRRFSESVKGNYEYQIVVQDVIEYPPKVSVMINARNSYDIGDGEYTIQNKIDAVLEE